jgi:vanillate O-demethylase monooxygenase subunit
MIDNLMDLTHETYVHSGSIGQPEIMEAPIETRVVDETVFVSRWMPGIEPPPFWRSALKQDGLVDRWQVCQFVLPSSVMIDVGVAPVGARATLEHHDQGVRGIVVDCMTPAREIAIIISGAWRATSIWKTQGSPQDLSVSAQSAAPVH